MARLIDGTGDPDLSQMNSIRSILVIRLKALGDIVLSLPVVYALRRRYPEARIAYLCRSWYVEALAGDTGLDEVFGLPRSVAGQMRMIARLGHRRFDLALDLLSSPRSALITYLSKARLRIGMDVGRHNWCYRYVLPRAVMQDGRRVMCYTLESNREMLRLLRLDPGPPGFDVGFPAADLERGWADSFMEGLGPAGSKLVGIAPAATYPAKSWPEDSFVELCRIISLEFGLVPIILWGPGEKYLADRIVSRAPAAVKAPECGIARLGALIAGLRMLVTLDGGPKHLAVMQRVPTVTLFGPTDPRSWDPMNERHRVLCRDMDCRPCRNRNCSPNRCLTEITPREVAAVAGDLLASIAAGPAP